MGANGLGLSDIVEDWQGEVQTTDGPVKVRTLLNLYKELTEEYTPENVERLTHVKEDKIRRLTNDIVEAESTGFLTGMSMNMYFHNDLINRAYYVVATLSGNVGKPVVTSGATPVTTRLRYSMACLHTQSKIRSISWARQSPSKKVTTMSRKWPGVLSRSI